MRRELEQTSIAPHGGFIAAPEIAAFNASCLLTARSMLGEPAGGVGGAERQKSPSITFLIWSFKLMLTSVFISEHPLGSGSKIPFIRLKCQDLQVQEIFKCLSKSLFVCK